MLFNPNFVDETLGKSFSSEQNHQAASVSSGSYKMFSPTSPSPTRSMIKEANDHLQLLHQRVMELEKTVQEQAEALIKKDELMQQKLCELGETKDAVIGDLKQTVSTYDQRVKKLELQCKESNRMLELMNQKCLSAEELDVYIPTLEKLLSSMRKLSFSSKYNSTTGGVVNCVNTGKVGGNRARKVFRGSTAKLNNDKHPPLSSSSHRSGASAAGDVLMTSDGSSSVLDGVATVNTSTAFLGQLAMADLRIGRSFNINSNFSMSEDEDEADKYS